MPKRPIREQLLAQRRHRSAEDCLRLSLLIQARFLDSAAYRQAGSIGLYSPMLNEVQTELVARRCLADGKRLSYPRIKGGGLEFVAVSGLGELAPGTYGIPEPTGEALVPYPELELLVVPGVAFDLSGHRLGYGKGYYDRTLARCVAFLERVGFAYEFQVVEQLPADPHDCRLTRLVTEQRILRFSPGGEDELPNHSRRGGAGC
jgi:5-formyltetrahydrofolate cyclo-ligase